jgi:hypothetical protein
MRKQSRKQSRRNRDVRSTCKSVWLEYERQKKRLSQCPRKYETEARKVAAILGL